MHIYTETARVVAHLAVGPRQPDGSIDPVETQFWELYYGQLPFVESTGENSVAAAMNSFCVARFGPQNCSRDPNTKMRTPGTLPDLAIKISEIASKEIRRKWEQK